MMTPTPESGLSAFDAATPAAAAKTMLLVCPLCGELEASLSLHLATGEFACQECNGEFNQDLIRDIVERWPAVLKWLDAMPTEGN